MGSPAKKKQGETFVVHLHLDGVNEYHKSKNKIAKLFWFCITFVAYASGAYLSYLTITRYDLGKTIVTVDYQPPTDNVIFPWNIGMCIGASWNKTYLEEAIPVPDEILKKASMIGLTTKSQVLSEFAKYLSYYNYFYFDDEQNLREDIWALMKELYELVFKNYQMADIAQDGIIRSKVFRCWYNGRKYPCDRAWSFSADSPSCHLIPVAYQDQSRIQYHAFERATLKIDIDLPIKDTFHDDPRESRSTSNAGVKLFLTEMPTPFNPHWALPANTHAVILFHHRDTKLKSKCAGDSFLYTYKQSEIYDPEFHWFKTYETCLANVFEYASKNACGCYLTAGSYYPDNNLACTPDQIRHCVQPRLLDVVNEEPYAEQKRKCLYHCTVDNVAASVTYYDLENISNESIRNVITIRPNLEQGFYAMETDLHHIYELFSQVGGVVVVYTGLSIAAFVRVSALLIGAGQSETLIKRLDLDGLNEYHKSKNKLVKLFWFCVTATLYVTAAVLAYLTITRYDLGKTIVSVDYRPPIDSVTFPYNIGMCFGASWNKTYLEEAIPIPDEILKKASVLGLTTKSQVLSEFAKYLSYYNYFYFDDEQNIREDIWALMKQLYGYVFKNYQMADIAQDGIIRSKVFRCWYNGHKYPCDRAWSFSADSPSCHGIPVDYQGQSRIQHHTFERATLKIDIDLPIKDTFHDDPRESRSTSNAGVRFFLTEVPTAFNPQWVVPANTHAVILFHHRDVKLKSKCAGDSFLYSYKQSEIYDEEFHWFKTYESCLATVFEYAARNVCGCYIMAASYFPSNDLACTPDQIRNCVQPRMLDVANEERYVEQTRKCLYHCTVDNVAASVTYYDLENISNESIRNVITFRPNLEQGFYHEEHDLANFYAAFSEVGGVIGVYTGFSIALFVRVLGLFCVAGIQWAIPRFVKPALMAALRINTPLNAHWNVEPHWFHQRRIAPLERTKSDVLRRRRTEMVTLF